MSSEKLVGNSSIKMRRLRFAREYMIDNNAQNAALRSGYAMATAKRASAMLDAPDIAKEISRIQKEQMRRCEIRADDVLGELLAIAKSNPADMFDERNELKSIHDMPREVTACIKSVKKRIDKDTGLPMFEVSLWDKPKCLETLARHLGLLQDNTNIKVSVGIPPELAQMSDVEINEAIAKEALSIKGK